MTPLKPNMKSLFLLLSLISPLLVSPSPSPSPFSFLLSPFSFLLFFSFSFSVSPFPPSSPSSLSFLFKNQGYWSNLWSRDTGYEGKKQSLLFFYSFLLTPPFSLPLLPPLFLVCLYPTCSCSWEVNQIKDKTFKNLSLKLCS